MKNNHEHLQVNLSECPNYLCGECGNKFFYTKKIIKKVPGILIGQTRDIWIPIEVFVCTECGNFFEYENIPQNPKN